MAKDPVLAYVFWHWRKAHVPLDEYADRLRDFHATLAQSPSEGLIDSFSLYHEGAAWLSGADPHSEVFEDWYLLKDFAALGSLNDGAVAGNRAPYHREIAARAGGGVGGVYALRLGKPLCAPGWAYWFAKPEGTTYGAFYGRLAERVEQAKGCLWQRQLVLGPAPEFCMHLSAGGGEQGKKGLHAVYGGLDDVVARAVNVRVQAV